MTHTKEHAILYTLNNKKSEDNQLRAYHISFVFDQKQPGVITIPGETADAATENFMKMMEHFNNVEIIQIVDLAEIPFLKRIHDAQKENEEEETEESPGDNVFKFEPKPN